MDIICKKGLCVCGCGEDYLLFLESIGDSASKRIISIHGYWEHTTQLWHHPIINWDELPNLFIGEIHIKKSISKEAEFFIEVKRAFN